jgi:hypothetical protein
VQFVRIATDDGKEFLVPLEAVSASTGLSCSLFYFYVLLVAGFLVGELERAVTVDHNVWQF